MAEINPAARVEPKQVRDLIETELSDEQINAHINTAHLFTDEITGLLPERLDMIEMWLSAHFVAITDPELKGESVGGEWSVQYNMANPGEGLRATRFGQQALQLDTTGTLAEGLKSAKFRVHSLRRN